MRAALLAIVLSSCAEPPAPAAPLPPAPVEPEPAPSPPPEPAVDPPVHDCGQDPAGETPIVVGRLGDGERVVRLINNSPGTIQARILHESLEPALAGTLHVEAFKQGEFHVPEGVYVVRYRYGTTCEVRRGKKLMLTGPRAGVEIAIKPHFEEGQSSNMERVVEPL
jgi:hypothetical protein